MLLEYFIIMGCYFFQETYEFKRILHKRHSQWHCLQVPVRVLGLQVCCISLSNRRISYFIFFRQHLTPRDEFAIRLRATTFLLIHWSIKAHQLTLIKDRLIINNIKFIENENKYFYCQNTILYLYLSCFIQLFNE